MPERLMPQLEPLIEQALKISDEAEMRELMEREAMGRRISARSNILPSFGGSVTYRQEEDQNQVEGGFEERLIYSFALTQPVYHWGARQADKQIGELLYELELLNTQTVRERLIANIRSLYMNLLVDRQQLAWNRRALEMKRRELETQRERMQEGLASATDLFTVELEIDRLELSEARNALAWESRVSELAHTLGLDRAELEAVVTEEIPRFERMTSEEIAALSAYFNEGLAQNEALKRKDIEILMDRKRLLIEGTALKPKVDLQVGVSQNALDADGVRREQEFLYGGFRVNWAIFDGFRARGRKMEARARLERNEQSKEILEESLRRDYVRALSNVDVATRALEIEEKLLANRTRGFEKSGEDLEAGLISEIVYQEQEQDFRQQSIRTQQARSTYLNALSDLSLLLGIDPDALERQDHIIK